MQRLLFLLILCMAMAKIQAADHALTGEILPEITQIGGLEVGEIPSAAKNCRSVQKAHDKKKSKFSARLVLEAITNPGQAYGVKQINDCYNNSSSQFQSDQALIFDQIYDGTFSTGEELFKGLNPYSKTWTTNEKVCFVSIYQELIADYYEIDDLRTHGIGTDQALKAVRNDEGSSGVCIHIHRSGAEVGNSLGLKCGTFANSWDTGVRRAGHGATACRGVGENEEATYYMINYGKSFELDVATYQEAIDASSLFLGPMNVNGVQMTCIDPEMKAFANCDHTYLPRDARWGLSIIKGGIDALATGEDLVVQLSNVEIQGTLTFGEHKKKEVTKSNGKSLLITTDSGLVITHSTYKLGQTQMTSIGYGLNHEVTRERSSSSIQFYTGGYIAQSDNLSTGSYLDEDKLTATGVLAYAKGEHSFELGPTTRVHSGAEVLFGASYYFKDPGIVDQVELEIEQDIDKFSKGFIRYRGGIIGSMDDNGVTLADHHIQTGLRFEVGDDTSKLQLYDEFSVHYLDHKSSSIENELQVSVRPSDKVSIAASSHLGETYSRDIFYDHGSFMENSLELQLKPIEKVALVLEGTQTTGQLPAHLGEGLMIEENPIPERTLPGYYGGIRLDARF